MKVELTQQEVLDAVKPLTRATTSDYTDAIKRIVYSVATAVAFLYAIGTYVRDVVKTPRKYLEAYGAVARRSKLEPVLAPVVEEVSVPTPVVAEVIAVQQVGSAPVPVKSPRSRKRSAKNAAQTSPAGFA